MENLEMETDSKEEVKVVPKELTVEEMLPLIGECGTFQKLLVMTFMAAMFAVSMQSVLPSFIALTPTWKCVGTNSTDCRWNGTFFFLLFFYHHYYITKPRIMGEHQLPEQHPQSDNLFI